ncbi:MAG: hypothetical protein GYB65_07945 [Chloroflexi bacterium]|nr:hypothetical protein [Chloroflexota bacterium]
MTPFQAEGRSRWVEKIRDRIGSDATIREGLQDDAALPLMDWGWDRAARLGARLSAEQPDLNDEQVVEAAHELSRLMARVAWLAVYRHQQDAAWMQKTFHTINETNRQLFGPDAPAFSDQEIADWIASHENRSNEELVRALLAHLTP